MRDPNEFRDEVYRRAEKQRKRERRKLSAVLGCVTVVAVVAVSAHAFAPLTAKDTANYADKESVQLSAGTTDTSLTESSQVSAQTLLVQIEQNDICLPSVSSFDDYNAAADYFTQISRKQASDFSDQGFSEEYFFDGSVIFIIMQPIMYDFTIDIGESEEKVTVNINASFDDNNSQKYLLCIPSPKVNGRHVSLLINGTVFN